MLVSEIMGARARQSYRRVGVTYDPDERHKVMAAAVDLYRHLGLDVDVNGLDIAVHCGEAISGQLMGLLERRTGHRGFNEWWGSSAA